jgi:hypothetical protein
MMRVLKPGGRVAVSDIALKKPVPAELAREAMAYVGCIAGAIGFDEYRRALHATGFEAVQVVDTKKDLNAYALVEGQAGCCAPAMSGPRDLPLADGPCGPTQTGAVHQGLAELLRKYEINEYAASVQVYALKPR